ncbi:DcuS/MalK family sensor histidine kinase [Orbaceae bacterium ac157xtp]
MKKLFHHLKLKTKLVILIFITFVIAVIAENIYIIHIVNNQYYEDTKAKVEHVANMVASSPDIVSVMSNMTEENKDQIQLIAERSRELSQLEFITIFNLDGIRYSHPDKNKIGHLIVGGDGKPALSGHSYTSIAKGTLGISVRAFRPIYSQTGQQIGAVMVGQTMQKIELTAARTIHPIIFALIISLLIAIFLALWFSRNIKKILLGLEPFEMVKLFEERNAIICMVKEGIVVVNREGKVTQINNEAKRILRIENNTNIIGQEVSCIIPNTRLYEVMQSGKPEYDNEQNINGIVILTNRMPLLVNGQLVGAIASFRDMTEIRTLAENLTGVNRYADALRSQSHEFNNQLHVIYGLACNPNKNELITYLEELVGNKQSESKVIDENIKDPTLAGFLISKFSRARELDVKLAIKIEGVLQPIPNISIIHRLVTIIGNLIDNSLDAVQLLDDKQLDIILDITQDTFSIMVKDNGPGIPKETINKIFNKGFSTKGDNRGFGLYLVLASIDELGGDITLCIENEENGACFKVSLPIIEIYQETFDD